MGDLHDTGDLASLGADAMQDAARHAALLVWDEDDRVGEIGDPGDPLFASVFVEKLNGQRPWPGAR